MKKIILLFISCIFCFSLLNTIPTGISLCQTSGNTDLIVDGGFDQITPYELVTEVTAPCPVGQATNPDPPNNACNISIFENTITWYNGLGTTQVELWFGDIGSLVQVYNGAPITSFTLPSINYNSTYGWYVICKNDTCGTQGQIWSFTTEQYPGIFYDGFETFCNWSIVGPLGLTNWEISNTNNAEGTAPELRMNWTPIFNGVSKIRSIELAMIANGCCEFSFDFYFDWYADPSGTVTVGITFDGGITSSSVYSVNDPTGNIGPLNFYTVFGTPSEIQNFQIEITYTGNSYNVNSIYWDNFSCQFWPEPYCRPGSPGNLTAQLVTPDLDVQLDWQDHSGNEEGFKIYRKNGLPNDPGIYDSIASVGQNIIQFIDSVVIPESTYTYKVSAFNGWGESESNPATITLAIPVELISFTSEVNENLVTLFWQTATETNNSGFEIHRCVQNDIDNWERVGFVEGAGTTTEIKNYSFTDNPEPGKYKYRLKQIDFDGSFEYSNEIEAELKVPNIFSLGH